MTHTENLLKNSQVSVTEGEKMDFISALEKAREGYPDHERWHVVLENHHTEYVTDGGSTFGIEVDGNIGGLCRNKNDTIKGHELLKLAVMAGGKKLQAFGLGLFEFYTKNRFRPISWVSFDETKAPRDWRKEFMKEPLIFYAHDSQYNHKREGLFLKFMTSTKKSTSVQDAYYERDVWIKNKEKQELNKKKKHKMEIKKQTKENKNGIY